MKNLLYLLFTVALIGCSGSDDVTDNVVDNVDDTNPVYLDTNGITVKARDWAAVGDAGIINGVLYTIVTKDFLTVDNDLTRVCTSRITNMRGLFNSNGLIIPHQASTNFNQDISSWDVSNVTNMGYMFHQATSFNQDLSAWDVSNVTNMSNMFFEAVSFNQDLSAWDVSQVTDFSVFSYNTPNWTLPKPNF